MKNKGFTIVEMLSAFLLSSIIIIIMFQLIINLKDIYQSSGIKTNMLNKKNIMVDKIYTDLNTKKAINIESCSNPIICVKFTFQDGSTKTLEVDETEEKISYGEYTIKLRNSSYFGTMQVSTTQSITAQKLFNINIPIYDEVIKNTDLGINIVYLYNESEVNNNYINKYVPPTDIYISLPYVRTDGNQYINLRYKAKINTEVRLDIEFIENASTRLASTSGSSIIGVDDISSSNVFTTNIGDNANQYKTFFYWLDQRYVAGVSTVHKKEYNTVTQRSTMIIKSGSATFQGETIETDIKTANNEDNMVLMGGFSTSRDEVIPFSRYDTKIYGFQIYEGNNPVMNLTPAKKRSSNQVGLYDTLSGEFFVSEYSGSFIAD